jgi:uncharacterized membrane protein YesL
MNSTGNNINFSFEYAVSIIVILVVCNLLLKSAPQMNTIIIIIVGLFIGYLSLLIMNTLVPKLNYFAFNLFQYFNYQFMYNFTNMGYVNIFPPILAILLVFIVLLYNKNLG